ncbi:MAG: hypothetical protein ABEJ85_06290, partial [Haloarculaceae archaeon]
MDEGPPRDAGDDDTEGDGAEDAGAAPASSTTTAREPSTDREGEEPTGSQSGEPSGSQGDEPARTDTERDGPAEPAAEDDAAGDGSADLPPDVRKYDRFKKIDGSTYDRANEFLRERTYITAR